MTGFTRESTLWAMPILCDPWAWNYMVCELSVHSTDAGTLYSYSGRSVTHNLTEAFNSCPPNARFGDHLVQCSNLPSRSNKGNSTSLDMLHAGE